MTPREFRSWREWWRQSPWGEERADARAAMPAYFLALAMWAQAPKGKRGPQPKVSDFLAKDWLPRIEREGRPKRAKDFRPVTAGDIDRVFGAPPRAARPKA